MKISDELAANGITHIFIKYMEKIRDYFRELIKWTM
jgi:hypothetical protein